MSEYLNFPGKELNVTIIQSNKLFKKNKETVLKKSNTPKSFDNKCNLCLEEKIHILLFPEPKKLLNKRNELIARCKHRAKFKL